MNGEKDWRLSMPDDVESLKNVYINGTDGEEICEHAPYLKYCEFCREDNR